MEINSIQMAASAGHAVAYTIGPIFQHIIDCVQLYFTNGFTNQTISALRLIMRSSKNRAQNIECSFGCGALSAVLLKLNVANIFLFNFCEQKFVQHGLVTIAINSNGLSLLIFEEKCPNYVSGLKSEPNSDSVWVRRVFNICMQVFCAPNATILLVYVPANIKLSFI